MYIQAIPMGNVYMHYQEAVSHKAYKNLMRNIRIGPFTFIPVL